jgi:ribosomal protein S18 acetylase RimI-like enzyme
MGSITTLRRAIPNDLGNLIPQMAAFNAEEQIQWRLEAMQGAMLRLLRESSLGVVVVAESAGPKGLSGYGVATFGYDLEFAGRDAFVTELFILPEMRRRGLGHALLEALIDELRNNDVHAAHLMVRPENEKARRVYHSLGFQEVPRITMSMDLV